MNKKFNSNRWGQKFFDPVIIIEVCIFIGIILVWITTVDKFNSVYKFFSLYYYTTFARNIIITLLGLTLGYIILGGRQWPTRTVNATIILSSLLLTFSAIELPAFLGWIDYRTLLVPKIQGGSGPHNRVFEPEGYFHRPPNDHFSNALPGDAVFMLGIETNRLYQADYIYDENGFRNNYSVDKTDLILVGDSFTDGYKVDQSVMLSAQLSHNLGTNIENLSQSGFGPPHEEVVIRHIGIDMAPKRIIWFFFEGNDLYNYQENQGSYNLNPSYKDRSFFFNTFAITALHTNRWVLKNRDSGFEVSGELFVGMPERMYFEIPPFSMNPTRVNQLNQFKAIFLETKALCQQHEIELILVFVPLKFRVYQNLIRFPEGVEIEKWELNNMPELILQWTTNTKIPFLDLTPALISASEQGVLTYFLDDAHWTPAGHEIVANTVTEFIHALDGETSVTPP